MKKIYVAIVILVLLGLSLYLMEGDEKDNKKGNKKDNKKGDKDYKTKKDDKDYKCYHDGNMIGNCNTLSFNECVKCEKELQASGILLNTYCGESDNAKSNECFDIPDNTNGISLAKHYDFKNIFCSSNQNATYDDCEKANYEDVYCDNNPHHKNDEDLKKCTALIAKDRGECSSNTALTYEDCENQNNQNDYCARNPNVKWDNDKDDDVNKCCPSTTDYQKDYLETNYIKKYKTPQIFDTPKIEELSLQTAEEVNTHACTLRDNCKNIEVTPENVYLARKLCSDIKLGRSEDVSKKYDFSDSICKKIPGLVEKNFNNIYLAVNNDDEIKLKDGFVGEIDKDGVYTYNIHRDSLDSDHKDKTKQYKFTQDNWMNDIIKHKIANNGYDNLIREYCHCWNNDPKPEETEEQEEPDICKLFGVKPKVTN